MTGHEITQRGHRRGAADTADHTGDDHQRRRHRGECRHPTAGRQPHHLTVRGGHRGDDPLDRTGSRLDLGPAKEGPDPPQLVELGHQLRVAGQRRLEFDPVRVVDLIVEVRAQPLAVHDSTSLNRERPRWTRDRTVPTGTPSWPAISS